MQSRQQGFTLVELIVVIVILGILAATALPKFIDLSSDARIGVMKGVESSMRGANMMLYGKAAAAGLANQAAGTDNKVTVNGTEISLAYGYAKNAEELAKVLDLNPDKDFETAVASAGVVGSTGGVYHTGSKDTGAADSASFCRVEYVPATDTDAPKYELIDAGC